MDVALPIPWRVEFLEALRLLADVSEALFQRGGQRPVLVGGGAVEFYTGSVVMTGDIDITTIERTMLDEELQRHGFVRPSGSGVSLRGWIHPDLGFGFEWVADVPMDGNVAADYIRLVAPVTGFNKFRVISVEDLIADRMGQFGAHCGGSDEMRVQAAVMLRLNPEVNRYYLDRRIREETGGDYGIDDIEG